MKELTTEQRTYDWYKARLGMFTASQIAKLMVSGKKKEDYFGETAKTYIALVAMERKIKEKWDSLSDEERDEFIRNQYPANNAMKWGTYHEAFARNAFEFEHEFEVIEFGSCVREERDYVSASPDGYIKLENAIVEIKCPQIETYGRYVMNVVDALTLKAEKADYYWQMMLQMWITDAEYGYFVWYHPYLGMKYAHIERNDEDINTMLERIDKAEELAKEIYSKL